MAFYLPLNGSGVFVCVSIEYVLNQTYVDTVNKILVNVDVDLTVNAKEVVGSKMRCRSDHPHQRPHDLNDPGAPKQLSQKALPVVTTPELNSKLLFDQHP